MQPHRLQIRPEAYWQNVALLSLIGRSDWIRTSDPQSPRLMRYQAALRSDPLDVTDILGNKRLTERPKTTPLPTRKDGKEPLTPKPGSTAASPSDYRPRPALSMGKRQRANWTTSTLMLRLFRFSGSLQPK